MTIVLPAAEPRLTVSAPSDAGNGRKELVGTFELDLPVRGRMQDMAWLTTVPPRQAAAMNTQVGHVVTQHI